MAKKANFGKEFQKLYDTAHAAGMEAVRTLLAENGVVPMVVLNHENPMDDASPVTKRFFVADGLCGFAWIKIRPANCAFAKWAVANHIARGTAYDGGVNIWVSEFNQSVQKKEAYAHAFAAVLSSTGIKAYGESRLD